MNKSLKVDTHYADMYGDIIRIISKKKCAPFARFEYTGRYITTRHPSNSGRVEFWDNEYYAYTLKRVPKIKAMFYE